jgi:hypothetical protein
MEQAPFFETCHRMGIEAASIVLGSDRYTFTHNQLKHDYLGNTDKSMQAAFQASVESLLRR